MPELSAEMIEKVKALRTLALLRELRPYTSYSPSNQGEYGQLQFHQSTHVNRFLFPGNGFGKTRAAGQEMAWHLYHCHPYQSTPAWAIIAIWCCETYKQFEILRAQLQEEVLGPERSYRHPGGWRFNRSDRFYQWADGSKMYLVSGDSSWTHIQGIPADLVEFDEEPPWALYNELTQRRRGKRKTRYLMTATATQGLTWTYQRLYVEWLKWYAEHGMTLDQAIRLQCHPLTWLLERGGIDDNPGADEEDRAYYRLKSYGSEAEKSVRLHGGFRDFSGTPVFDTDALEQARVHLEDGTDGSLVPELDEAGKAIPRKFAFVPDGRGELGRVTIYRMPRPGELYVIGHDSAYGLENKDCDYASAWQVGSGEQVAEAQGRWGDVHWVEVLEALHWFYNMAFLVGERQVGLPVMRRLYDERGVYYQYYNRDDAKRARRRSDTLGHARNSHDLIIRNMRVAIAGPVLGGHRRPPEILIHSKELHRQCCVYQFRPQSSTRRYEEIIESAQLTTGAPPGDHDDGVMSAAYGVLGLHEVHLFPPAEELYAVGTPGRDLQELFAQEQREKRHHKPFSRGQDEDEEP